MISRRKLISFGLFTTTSYLFCLSQRSIEGLQACLFQDYFEIEDSVQQVVVMRSLKGEFSTSDQFKDSWNNVVSDSSLSFSDLCELRESGAILSEDRTLVDSRTHRTIRIWKSKKHFNLWVNSQQRKSMKNLLQNNTQFSLIAELIKPIQDRS